MVNPSSVYMPNSLPKGSHNQPTPKGFWCFHASRSFSSMFQHLEILYHTLSAVCPIRCRATGQPSGFPKAFFAVYHDKSLECRQACYQLKELVISVLALLLNLLLHCICL